MGKILFVTGPVRSGKSRFALEKARGWGDVVVYVATYRENTTDAEMGERVTRHRMERPATWRTLEAPEDVACALGELDPPPSGVLMDCLTLWLSWRMERMEDAAILDAWKRQLDAFKRSPWPIAIVGNEVGWAPVPVEPELRRFRDLAGWLAQETACVAEEVWLCVAGCPLRIK